MDRPIVRMNRGRLPGEGDYARCPSCQWRTPVGRDFGPGREYAIQCELCRALDRKQRTPVTLANAVAFARTKLEGGCSVVYLRDLASRKVRVLRREDLDRIVVDEPDRLVEAVAVR